MPGQRSVWHPEPPKVARKPAKPKGMKREQTYRVNVRETPELHVYRASAAVWVRYLPLKLQGPMFAHVIMADIDGDPRKYSWEKAAAWSKVIAPRYKLPAVGGLRQFRENSSELREMGLIFYDLDVTETYLDHDGKVRGNRLNEFDVDMMAVEMYAMAAKVEKEVKEADKAARRAATKAKYDEKRRADRAAQAYVGTVNPPPDSPPDSPPEPPDKSYCVLSDASLDDANAANITSGEARDDDGVEESSPKSKAKDDNLLAARECLAGWLGVTPASIGWNAVGLADSLADTYGLDIVEAAAQQSRKKGDTPVALFVSSAESMCAGLAAEQQRLDDYGRRAKRTAEDEIIKRRIAEFRSAARATRKRAEREAAEAEYERLVPEFNRLAAEYSPARSETAEHHSSARERDPRRRAAGLGEAVAWYRQQLAERAERAPLTEQVLAYVTAAGGNGVNEHEVADALGVKRLGWEVLDDLKKTGRVRYKFGGGAGDMYWLAEENTDTKEGK